MGGAFSVPLILSCTALRVTDAIIGPKVKIFVFRRVCMTFSHLGKRAEICHINPSLNSSR